MPEQIQRLLHQLEHLRQGVTPDGLAPHKPVLILSLIEYLETKGLKKNEFPIDMDLFNLFKSNWKLLVTRKNICDIIKPLFYLQSDGIWTLSTEAKSNQLEGIKSIVRFQEMAPFGYLNSRLFEALLILEIREVVRTIIFGRYFPQTESQYYQQYGATSELITADELILQEPVIGYTVKKISIRIYEGFVRDQRFRRQVLDIYDYRCAMSGYSIKGIPIIEACHN
jgi:putative restriction endonuclease